MTRSIDPSLIGGERKGDKFSMEGRKPAYAERGGPRHAHWSEQALSGIEQAGKVVGAAGTMWQLGRGVVATGRILAPLLAMA